MRNFFEKEKKLGEGESRMISNMRNMNESEAATDADKGHLSNQSN